MQLRLDVLVNSELAGVDDAHIKAGFNGVVQEHRVHCFANGVVAAERERNVARRRPKCASRARRFDSWNRLDEVDRVVVVLLNAGGDGQDVRVEDNVLRREADFFGEQFVGSLANADFVVDFDRLALLVERHDDDRRAIPAAELCAAQELLFAVFEADRVDDRLALQRLQAGFDNRPFAAVDHHRHGADVVFAGDEPQVFRHDGFAIEQSFVHVDIDDVRAAVDLRAGDFDGFLVLLVFDEPGEFSRTGDVGPLADHEEIAVGTQRKRPRTAEPHIRLGHDSLVRLACRGQRQPSR